MQTTGRLAPCRYYQQREIHNHHETAPHDHPAAWHIDATGRFILVAK